ncbi:glycosyltransferase family 32 protein [Candidatus Sulfurimonas baltica]|uniref:Glycosyl transferase n=1 Tax=Candidatus Sulfurimonas baltica TaxID=2740404 RepID=A0A7S7LU72_9BACT|nr:glycosyltransferase [Candidatus Sulfurimonas baltica]QOY51412.1 glycosyl transferase [Candidatus Sulfurimonas baltica]
MSFPILVSNRLIKILGTITKTLCYPFHYIFPKKRFKIPEISKPIFTSKTASKIPKIIWQTNYTNNVSLPVYLNYLFNRLMSLDHEYRYVSTEARLEYMKTNAPKEISEAFEQLTDGASQADFWRVFVLNHIGGTYMDIDAHLVWPLSKIIKPDDTEVFLLTKQHYSNYFIASQKNNPVLEKSLNIIVDNIVNKNLDGGIYNLTGPNVLNIAIGDKKVNHRFYRITCVQGSFTNEYFQYIDKPRGKWIHAKKEDLIKG